MFKINGAHQAVPSVPTARSEMEKQFAMNQEGRNIDPLLVAVTTWCISRTLAQLVHYSGKRRLMPVSPCLNDPPSSPRGIGAF